MAAITQSQNQQQPPATTFPRATFAKLSPHPFLLANLQPREGDDDDDDSGSSPATAAQGQRTNGRSPLALRPVKINTGSLSHAQGSAVVRAGDTTVICGVRAEVLPVAHIPNYRARPSPSPPHQRNRRRRRGPRSNEEEEEEEEKEEDDDDNDESEEARQDRCELRDYDLIVPNIELATGCAPQFLPGVPPTALAQTLSTRVYSLLHSARVLDVEDLKIWYTPPPSHTPTKEKNEEDDDAAMEDADADVYADEGREEPELKAFWTLFIDVLFVSFDGNPFDVAWAAVLAALRDTVLPHAWWDGDREMVLCSRRRGKSNNNSSNNRCLPRKLSVGGLPVACTAAVFKEKGNDLVESYGVGGGDDGDRYWVLVDPDREEEELCEEFVTVVVDRSGSETKVLSMLKSGGTTAGLEFIRRMVGVAERRWDDVKAAMD